VANVISLLRNEDRLFAALFKEISPAGSYYEGLKVGSANEFDLNLILDLQTFAPYIKFHHSNEHGFMPVQCINNDSRQREPSLLIEFKSKFLNQRGYLVTSEVRHWMDNIMERIKGKIELPAAIEKVRHLKCI
jgi:hypothetical protein